jgi:hypothetical protein
VGASISRAHAARLPPRTAPGEVTILYRRAAYKLAGDRPRRSSRRHDESITIDDPRCMLRGVWLFLS